MTPSDQYREEIYEALKAGGPSYDFDVIDACTALEALLKRAQREAVEFAIGEALWSFSVWNRVNLTPDDFSAEVRRITENVLSSENAPWFPDSPNP